MCARSIIKNLFTAQGARVPECLSRVMTNNHNVAVEKWGLNSVVWQSFMDRASDNCLLYLLVCFEVSPFCRTSTNFAKLRGR